MAEQSGVFFEEQDSVVTAGKVVAATRKAVRRFLSFCYPFVYNPFTLHNYLYTEISCLQQGVIFVSSFASRFRNSVFISISISVFFFFFSGGVKVLVMNEARLVGVVTPKDLMRVVFKGVDARITRLKDVMIPAPDTVKSDTTVVEAIRKVK